LQAWLISPSAEIAPAAHPGEDESLCTIDIHFKHIDSRQQVIFHEFAHGDALRKKIILVVSVENP
jgi:hypothetical protein